MNEIAQLTPTHFTYGVAFGIFFAVAMFMTMFAMNSFVDKFRHAGAIFVQGAISIIFISLFILYILYSFDPTIVKGVPEWLVLLGKLSMPISMYFAYRNFVSSLPIETMNDYSSWKKAKDIYLLLNPVLMLATVLLFFIDNANQAIILSLGLIVFVVISAFISTKDWTKQNHLKRTHHITIIIIATITLIAISLVRMYGVQGINDIVFLAVLMLLGIMFNIYIFVIIKHNLKESANSEITSKLITDGFFRNIYHALHNNEFFLMYQPKIDLDTKAITGTEVLIRWIHGTKGFIPPDEFIPVAEKTEVINDICQWVITQVIEDIKKLRQKGFAIPISINFSVVNMNLDLVNFLINSLKDNDLPSSAIVIEITETLFLEINDELLESVNLIKQNGIGLSLDDFGAGHSSLRHLGKLQLQEVKIDKSLIQEIDDEQQRSVVKTLITMCHALDLKVVAEGIETDEVMQDLLSLNCQMGQGYGIARPQKIDDLIEWVENYTADKV